MEVSQEIVMTKGQRQKKPVDAKISSTKKNFWRWRRVLKLSLVSAKGGDRDYLEETSTQVAAAVSFSQRMGAEKTSLIQTEQSPYPMSAKRIQEVQRQIFDLSAFR